MNAAGQAGGWTQFGRQAVLAVAGIACPSVMTWIILWVTDHTVGLRVSPGDEETGLDLSEHAEAGYQPIAAAASMTSEEWRPFLARNRSAVPTSCPSPKRWETALRVAVVYYCLRPAMVQVPDPGRRGWRGTWAGVAAGVSYWMISATMALDSAPASVRRTSAGTCSALCGYRLAAATVTAASSAMQACSRLIARPLTSQRPSGWCSATAMHGPLGSTCALRQRPSLDGLIITPA